jgi:hypothetical protein
MKLTSTGLFRQLFQVLSLSVFVLLAAVPRANAQADDSRFRRIEVRDLDGDGVQEVITYEATAPRYAFPEWPTAHRWDGLSFKPTLMAVVYAEFIDAAERTLRGLEGREEFSTGVPASSKSFLMTRLGHAYTILDRIEEAHAQYELAWRVYQGVRESSFCLDPADAVSRYYQSQVAALPRAYALASEERRRIRPFSEFAAGFARTRAVALIETPVVIDREDELYRVAIDVIARDLTVDGETAQRFTGTWLVRQLGRTCTLEGAEIRLA